MKDKKRLYTIIGIIIAVIIISIFVYNFLNDKNKLNKNEKNWITNNVSVVQNINVLNNANVFGDNGTGVFFDFIKDFQSEYRLKINPVTFLNGEQVEGVSFTAGNQIDDNSIVFYEDHYVIVGREKNIYDSSNAFKNNEIGVLQSDSEYLKGKVLSYNYRVYDSDASLFEALKTGEINYAMVSLIRNIDRIFSNDLVINYHFSDVKYYYYFEGIKDDTLSSIIRKYFNRWNKKYFNDVFNNNEFLAIASALNLTEADVSTALSKTYNYGFINQNPYEVITGGNFGGISAIYLKYFSEFSDIKFNFRKFSSANKFKKAIKSNSIDIYLNYYLFDDNYEDIYNSSCISFDIIAPVKNNVIINDLNVVDDSEVYVLKSSKISRYLSENSDFKLKYYETISEMLKLARKGKIIAIDTETFNYFHKNKLKNYESRYSKVINDSYTFKIKGTSSLKRLFSSYTQTLDPNIVIYEGINNHNKTVSKGETLANIAKYFIYLLLGGALFMIFFYKKSKRVSVAKKIRNDEKIKYIDLLTSLKNRNYLSENMESWNNNKIYPQTMIVIDLNNIAFLNDRKGYEAGDRQIAAMANILIKTQLDNSDIMRTNGNEFLVYLVGYQQKHIVNYIHKLTKEMKKLPYEYGAAIGYSMINDDIKTIEDAINEALEDMKKQKAKSKEV